MVKNNHNSQHCLLKFNALILKPETSGKPVETDGKPVETDGKPVETGGKPVETGGKPVRNRWKRMGKHNLNGIFES